MTSSSRISLVTGANRGIGLALVEALVGRGDHVHATARRSSDTAALDQLAAGSDQIDIHHADTTSADEIRQLASAITASTPHLDLVVNNAGVMADHETLDSTTVDDLTHNYLVNAVGPLLTTQACLPLLRAAAAPAVVNISSSFASIELKNPNMPPRYSYSMSKAAVNMLTKTMAAELADEITVVAIHPGWTRTGIGGPEAQLAPEESAAGIATVVDGLTPADSGTFVTWTGQPLPW